jgi:hypothetical protein
MIGWILFSGEWLLCPKNRVRDVVQMFWDWATGLGAGKY